MAGVKASQAAESGETQARWWVSSPSPTSFSSSSGRGDQEKKDQTGEVDRYQFQRRKTNPTREAERAERILHVVCWGPHLV
ncbi:hypothetical protein LINGRAHAP2_LOCUS28766 [Linum grandiflorum]